MVTQKLRNNRVKIKCIYNNYNLKPRLIDAVFDTGAMYSVFTAKSVNRYL